MNTIDYSLLADATKHYRDMGYAAIEVPWRVSVEVLNITKPAYVTNTDYKIEGTNKALIASGEQGFMYLMNKGHLPPGGYQTITPCFRNEQYDATHSKQFMKLELIEVVAECQAIGQHHVRALLDVVLNAMKKLAPSDYHRERLMVVQQSEWDPLAVPGTVQLDIEAEFNDKRVELGSFGARRAHFGAWVYGTGLAEPRFSKTMQALSQQQYLEATVNRSDETNDTHVQAAPHPILERLTRRAGT
jgi:hypothetical protein